MINNLLSCRYQICHVVSSKRSHSTRSYTDERWTLHAPRQVRPVWWTLCLDPLGVISCGEVIEWFGGSYSCPMGTTQCVCQQLHGQRGRLLGAVSKSVYGSATSNTKFTRGAGGAATQARYGSIAARVVGGTAITSPKLQLRGTSDCCLVEPRIAAVLSRSKQAIPTMPLQRQSSKRHGRCTS